MLLLIHYQKNIYIKMHKIYQITLLLNKILLYLLQSLLYMYLLNHLLLNFLINIYILYNKLFLLIYIIKLLLLMLNTTKNTLYFLILTNIL